MNINLSVMLRFSWLLEICLIPPYESMMSWQARKQYLSFCKKSQMHPWTWLAWWASSWEQIFRGEQRQCWIKMSPQLQYDLQIYRHNASLHILYTVSRVLLYTLCDSEWPDRFQTQNNKHLQQNKNKLITTRLLWFRVLCHCDYT